MAFIPPSFPEKPDLSALLATLSPEKRKMFEQMQASFNQAMTEAAGKKEANLRLSAEGLSGLSDEDLYAAVRDRLDALVSGGMASDLSGLEPEQMALYVVDQLDCEVNNGGLCQFFTNAGHLIPLVSESLGEIGAAEHQALFDDFVSRYHIDLHDRSAFRPRRVEEYTAIASRYPWQAFDDAYFALPLLDILATYIRRNIQHF